MLDAAARTTTRILAVSAEDGERQRRMVDRVREEYGVDLREGVTLLSDPDHAVIDRYGILNADASPDRPIPHPTTLVLDREGVVRWRFTEVDYRVRPTNQDILEALDAIR